MDKPMKLRYLIKNNGYWVYERRVPKKLFGHPFWGGKTKFTRPLQLKVGSPEQDVLEAWQEQDELFATAVQNISGRNIHIIDKRDRIDRAEKYLKLYGLEPSGASTAGVSEDEAQHVIAYKNAVLDVDRAFEDYIDWKRSEELRIANSTHELPKIGDDVPADIQVQQEAWTLWHSDTDVEAPVLFGDCWDIYVESKQLDMTVSDNQKVKRRWDRFCDLVGDDTLTTKSINAGLRQWLAAQRGRVNQTTGEPIRGATIEREFKIISAVLNVVAESKLPELSWRNPKLHTDQFAPSTERNVLPKDTLRALYQSVADTELVRHQPWKEFMLTVMCQSGMIFSEFLRIERANVRLDHEVPHLTLYSQTTKAEERKRIIPVPFKTERLRALLAEMDEGQESVFPPSIVTKRNGKWVWTKKSGVSNVSKQVKDWLAKVDSEGRGYTSYCFRHSFKHYLHVVGAGSLDVAYLAGWNGKDKEFSRQLKEYAKSGLETPEILRRFQQTVTTAMGFLEEDGSGKVLPFTNRAK